MYSTAKQDSENQTKNESTNSSIVPYRYAFTLRKLKNPTKSFDPVIQKITWLERLFDGHVEAYYKEYCKTGQPHIHGVFTTFKKIKRPKFIKVRGWSNNLSEVRSEAAWQTYIKKYQYQPTDQDLKDFEKYCEYPEGYVPPKARLKRMV